MCENSWEAAHTILSRSYEDLRAKLENLEGKYKNLVAFYDKYNGTPCEQIRHQQQVDDLNAKLEQAERALTAETTCRLEWMRMAGEHAKERDAALARVKELETMLAGHTRQGETPVLWTSENGRKVAGWVVDREEINGIREIGTRLQSYETALAALPLVKGEIRVTKQEGEEEWHIYGLRPGKAYELLPITFMTEAGANFYANLLTIRQRMGGKR